MKTRRVHVTEGEALRELREKKGWTKKRLAEAAGIAPQTVTQIERGRYGPSTPTLYKLAGALGVEPHVIKGRMV